MDFNILKIKLKINKFKIIKHLSLLILQNKILLKMVIFDCFKSNNYELILI